MSFSASTESSHLNRSPGGSVSYDSVSIPGSTIERYRRHPIHGHGALENFAGSHSTDRVHLIKNQTENFSWRKWLVGPYCFLYMSAYITSYYTFAEYVYAKIQGDLFPDISYFSSNGSCNVDTNSTQYKDQLVVQEHSSKWNTYYSIASGIPAIFSNVILGSSTDKFGRKFLFFLPCVGTLVRMLVSVVGIYTNFDLAFHIIGYVIEGLTGQMFTMLIVCFTYVADITPAGGKMRSFGITMIELSIGIAITILSFTTGYFIQDYGFFYPMLSAGIMMAASFVAAFFIPETFPPAKRDHSKPKITEKLSTAFGLFFGAANTGYRWMYNVIVIAFTMTMLGVFGRSSVLPLYLLDEPFCWTSEKIGYFASFRSIVQQFIGIGMVKGLQSVLPDVSIALIGCVSFFGGNVVEGLASTDVMLYIGEYMLCHVY